MASSLFWVWSLLDVQWFIPIFRDNAARDAQAPRRILRGRIRQILDLQFLDGDGAVV
jgi:hypothetical protein